MVRQDLTRTMQTLTALAEFERALAAMYQACGEQWPRDRQLFADLERAELDHADCVGRIERLLMDHPERFVPNRPLTPEAARCQVDYVVARTVEFRSGDVALRTALLAMREIERSILESRFYEVVTTDDPEYRELIHRLRVETRYHVESIEGRLRVDGGGSNGASSGASGGRATQEATDVAAGTA